MNWLNGLDPKNSLIAAVTGRILIRLCGVTLTDSLLMVPSKSVSAIIGVKM